MKYKNDEVQQKVEPFWKDAYHGTWFYGLWSLLFHGILLESRKEDQGVISLFQILSMCSLFLLYGANFVVARGHEYWQPGVYVSPKCSAARSYARPHQLFNDNIYYRCVLKAGGV